MASTKLRSSTSLPILLLSSLNLLLFVLSSASFAPVFLLRTPPTSFGWALFTTCATTLLSSLLGFYSQLTSLCFTTHISLALASILGQVLGFLALLLRPNESLQLLRSPRGPREQRLLVRIEEGMLLGTAVLQLGVMVSACPVQSCWVREYEGLEAEREASARKRSRRMARVLEEALANAEAAAEVKAREMDEKMRSKYGKWAKDDFS